MADRSVGMCTTEAPANGCTAQPKGSRRISMSCEKAVLNSIAAQHVLVVWL